MKKVLAILISSVMLASTLQVSIDHHFCGGELAATKLSLTGKLASCGMERVEGTRSSDQSSFEKRCCEDHMTFYKLAGNYIPEYSKLSIPVTGKDMHTLPVNNILFHSSDLAVPGAWVLPPGEKLKSAFSLSEICVFRI